MVKKNNTKLLGIQTIHGEEKQTNTKLLGIQTIHNNQLN